MMAAKLHMLSNNVKGIQKRTKRLGLIQFFKNKIGKNGVVFLQETHSTSEVEQKWNVDFNGQVFYSHGTSNSCGVLIAFLGNQKIVVKNQLTDKKGRILILDVDIDDSNYILINIYNPNTEPEQISTLNQLSNLLKSLDINNHKQILFAGDFNLFFDRNLEAKGGNPSLKQKSISKIIELKEQFDLCDIWRVRNPNSKVYTFRQNHCSGVINRKLDYFFISNSLQENCEKAQIFSAFASDHSAISVSISESKDFNFGSGLWKFNNSLIKDKNFVKDLKRFIQETNNNLSLDSNIDNQLRWELLKYEIRKFSIKFSKTKAKSERMKRTDLENKLKNMEKDLDTTKTFKLYTKCKEELDAIYQNIAEGIKIRSKCNWYEQGEKSTKYFLNLEKKNAIQGQIRKLFNNNKEINDQKEILAFIQSFYKNLFTENSKTTSFDCTTFLGNLDIPKLKKEQSEKCDGDLSETELLNAIKAMDNNKSPGNDGLSKEFYETFWNDIKIPFMNSIKAGKVKKKLSVSQRQAVIKLIEKKDKDKRFIENWRPISLLNVDYKIISKALAERLKKTLPVLISCQQSAYVPNRFIGEGGRLISDIIEMSEILNLKGYIVTMDIEKAFDSLSHTFLISVLKNFGFGSDFINWIKLLIECQESCILNSGATSRYFQLQRGARQGDPISAYLFILCLEVLFILIKNNEDIKGISIFDHCFLYTAYADDTTFFLKNTESISQLVKTFQFFTKFSGLKPNFKKCEIAGIGVLKSVDVAVCGMKCIDLAKETIKIIGIHFSYNKVLEKERNFYDTITKIQNVLKVWLWRNLSLEGRIVIFKSLAISKIVYLSTISRITNDIIQELKKIQKSFLWNSNPKIKYNTLCSDFKNGGLKSVDIDKKIISLQCSWVKRLYDEFFHDWKIIPLKLIEKYLGKFFKFHSNVFFNSSKLNSFPSFYKDLMTNWTIHLSTSPTTASCVLSQFLWFNKYIEIDTSYINTYVFANKNIKFISDLMDEDCNFKSWDKMKSDYLLSNAMHHQWLQILHAIPKHWLRILKNDMVKNNADNNLFVLDHHVIKQNLVQDIKKLTAKEIYTILILKVENIPTSQAYFENIFQNENLDWNEIYILPRIITVNSSHRLFQYKILHNILYLNKKLCQFGLIQTSLCSFCNVYDETFSHLFCHCNVVLSLWSQFCYFLGNDLGLPSLTLQTATFGFFNWPDNENYLLANHLLLLFKFHVYKNRDQHILNIIKLINDVRKVKRIEHQVSLDNPKKLDRYKRKWKITDKTIKI